MKCGELMSTQTSFCGPGETAEAAAKIMKERDLAVLAIVDQPSRQLLGILTDRDLCVSVVAEGKSPSEVSAIECVRTSLSQCKDSDDVEYCSLIMKNNRIEFVPIVDQNGKYVGSISQRDLDVFSKGTSQRKVSATFWRRLKWTVILVIIFGLAVIVIPNILEYQKKSRQAEVRVNLQAIRLVAMALYAEQGTFEIQDVRELTLMPPSARYSYWYSINGIPVLIPGSVGLTPFRGQGIPSFNSVLARLIS